MKIFNWVHHKLCHNKDGIFKHPCAKKNEEMIINNSNENADRKALLENVLFGDETWGGGILAIGTLGFDQINAINNLGEESEEEDEEEEEDSEVEKEYYNDNSDSDSDGDGGAYYEDEEKEELNPLMLNAAIFSCDENNDSKKKERITLADLFSADNNTNVGGNNVVIVKSHDSAAIKPPPLPISSSESTKTGRSFAKKIIPKLVGDQRPRHPINKLNQFMTRMLRRKIHPDMEGKKTQTKSSSLTTKGQMSQLH